MAVRLSPPFLWKQQQHAGPKTDAHMQQRRASMNTQKVCNPKRRRHKKPGQPLVFSPSLCIYFQVSAILSKPAERPGRRRRRRRYTVSRKTRAKEGKKENSHRKTKCIRRLPWRWPSCISWQPAGWASALSYSHPRTAPRPGSGQNTPWLSWL